jgi:hypothetical protein
VGAGFRPDTERHAVCKPVWPRPLQEKNGAGETTSSIEASFETISTKAILTLPFQCGNRFALLVGAFAESRRKIPVIGKDTPFW